VFSLIVLGVAALGAVHGAQDRQRKNAQQTSKPPSKGQKQPTQKRSKGHGINIVGSPEDVAAVEEAIETMRKHCYPTYQDLCSTIHTINAGHCSHPSWGPVLGLCNWNGEISINPGLHIVNPIDSTLAHELSHHMNPQDETEESANAGQAAYENRTWGKR
jgi:hypothetical protein